MPKSIREMLETLQALGSGRFQLNKLVDEALVEARKKLSERGDGIRKVPDVRNEWRFRKGFVRITGSISCEGGWAGDLTTLRRVGDMNLTAEGDRMSATVRLGLEKTAFGFERCRVDVKNLLRVTQEVTATVDDFSVDARISLVAAGGGFALSLDHLVVDGFGTVKIRTGGGYFHKVEDRLLEILVKHYRDDVVQALSKGMEDAVRKAIGKIDINKALDL